MTLGTLGLDNIAVAFALGPLRLGWRRIGLLGIAFGVSEAGLTWLGATDAGRLWLPAWTTTEAARAGALATFAVALMGLAWIRSRPAEIVANPWALIGLSVLLGLDNFVAGQGLHDAASSFVVVGTTGLLIGALAAAACTAGGVLFPVAPRARPLLSALMLMGLAAAEMV